MATAFVVWDRKAREIFAPLSGVFGTQAEADAIIQRGRSRSGKDNRERQNLERLQVNVD